MTKHGGIRQVGFVVIAVVLSACSGGASAVAPRYTAADQSLPAGTQQGWSFDGEAVGTLPATLHAVAGQWTVRAEADAPSPPNALCQTSTARWPVLLLGDDVYGDVELSARFKPIAGREDQAGGLIVRAQDGASYLITRANALENNVRLYTMRNDSRTPIANADRPVASGAWHDLAVEARGDRIRVHYDGEWVIDHHDGTFAAGRIGLWTKADSLTCFDDVVVHVAS